MKNTLFICFVIAFICIGCGANSDTPNPLGTMSCVIDSKPFTASEVGAVNIFGLVSITGDEKNSGTTVTLGIDSDDAKAGKSIDVGDISGGSFGSSLTAITIKKNGKETQFAASEGTITITSASKSEITGTFNLTATDLTGSNKDIKITNGKFFAKILF